MSDEPSTDDLTTRLRDEAERQRDLDVRVPRCDGMLHAAADRIDMMEGTRHILRDRIGDLEAEVERLQAELAGCVCWRVENQPTKPEYWVVETFTESRPMND